MFSFCLFCSFVVRTLGRNKEKAKKKEEERRRKLERTRQMVVEIWIKTLGALILYSTAITSY